MPFRTTLLPVLGLAAALTHAALAAPGSFAATVDVTVTDKGCEPATLSVSEGRNTFRIRNASRRALEWEILRGVEVVEERENIVPGFVQPLTATLPAGEYQMTCGLLSNPKGTLLVAAGPAAAAAKPAPPSAMDLVGPLAEYKVYVLGEADTMLGLVRALETAIKAGDLAEARRLYAPSRQPYERIEPIAELFNDLDNAMDARADDFERKEADPKWTGFHRIEKILFADNTTAGAAPFAAKLVADAETLRTRLRTLVVTPKAMVGGPAALLEEVAAKKISGEEDRYSRTDLWDFQANLDGAQRIVSLLRPLLQPRSPALLKRVDDNFAKVDAILARYKEGEGFKSYDALTEADRRALKGPIAVLAEELSKLRGTLGVR